VAIVMGVSDDGEDAPRHARLGPGRIHHCMRTIGQCEVAIEMMYDRALERRTFGRMLADHANVQAWIAESRIEIDMARLLVLKAAWIHAAGAAGLSPACRTGRAAARRPSASGLQRPAVGQAHAHRQHFHLAIAVEVDGDVLGRDRHEARDGLEHRLLDLMQQLGVVGARAFARDDHLEPLLGERGRAGLSAQDPIE
jgi:hypothetical protein